MFDDFWKILKWSLWLGIPALLIVGILIGKYIL